MKSNIIIIKIGGSVLTKKNTSGKLRRKLISNIALQLKQNLKKKNQKLILILGGGKNVHRMAKKYKLTHGSISTSQVIGALKAHLLAKRLQMDVSKIFLEHNISIFPLQTNNFFTANKYGNIKMKNTIFFNELLSKNFIPVLYGDMIFHPHKKFVILSGDKIAILLSCLFKVPTVIFATDVDGVYSDSNKIGNRDYLILKASVKKIKKILLENAFFKTKDATGELLGKIKEVSKKPLKTQVFILNGLKVNNIYKALKGLKVGTKIQ